MFNTSKKIIIPTTISLFGRYMARRMDGWTDWPSYKDARSHVIGSRDLSLKQKWKRNYKNMSGLREKRMVKSKKSA